MLYENSMIVTVGDPLEPNEVYLQMEQTRNGMGKVRFYKTSRSMPERYAAKQESIIATSVDQVKVFRCSSGHPILFRMGIR